MPRLSQEEIDALKAKHGPIYEVPIPRDEDEGGDVFVYARKMSLMEYNRFLKDSFDEDRRAYAMTNLANPCIVHPPPGELEALLKELPALTATVSDQLLKRAGGAKGVDAKKV
jgi:hypothetical protein